MQNKGAVLDENLAAPAIEPEMLSKLKKEDMQQAVVERFKVGGNAAASGKAPKKR
jgi:hypothetical protein